MTATEELRRLLTEAGVEWKAHRHVMPGSMAIQRETLWGQPTDVASGKPIPHVYHYRATEMGDGRLFLEAQLISPAQAIAATLGDGEYERKMDELLCRLTSGRWSKTREYDLDFMESMVREEFETEQAIAATLGDADATPTRQGVDHMTIAEAIAHEDWAATTAHGELAAEHAQMRDWLRELERLRDENARLRSELDSVGTAAYLYGRTDLADENAKLRELARGLGQCAQGVGCEDCLLYDRSEPDHCREERLSRELGIEVE